MDKISEKIKAARIAKGDARVQRGHQEVLQQRHPGLRAVRSDLLTAAWIAPAVEAVRRAAVCAAESLSKPAAAPLSASSAARLIAQGAVALLSAVGGLNEENRQAVLRAAGSLGKLPAEDYVHEELAWRLEA